MKHPEINLDVQDDEGYTPLHRLAAEEDSTAIVRLVLNKKGVKVNALGGCGWPPLFEAVKKQNIKNIHAFLKHPDMNINQITVKSLEGFEHKFTALHYAVRMQHEGIVQLLLKQPGIDINLQENWYQWTPLFFAIQNANKGIVNMFFDQERLDTSCKDKMGYPPLYYAVQKFSPNIVRMFLQNKACWVD